jgi:ferric-dicitrate binding protein FerR (iron transport regulator)
MNMEDDKQREQREDELLRRLLRLGGEPPPISEAVAQRIHQNVHAHWKGDLRRRMLRRLAFTIAGAIAACFAGLFVAWFWLVKSTVETVPVAIVQSGRAIADEAGTPMVRKSIVRAGSFLETQLDGRVFLRIFGGAELRLGRSTRIQFLSASDFVLKRGLIDLDTGNTGRRFTVSTSMGNIIDHGTRFQILLDDHQIEISVREGEVLLNRNGTARSIGAGSRLTALTNGDIFVSRFNPLMLDSEWASQTSPGYDLEGRSLMEFLSWISNQNAWKLEFAEPNFKKVEGTIVLHGSVQNLTSNQMLAAVLPVCGLSYKLHDGVLTIRSEVR